jgi:hypothetical protein
MADEMINEKKYDRLNGNLPFKENFAMERKHTFINTE